METLPIEIVTEVFSYLGNNCFGVYCCCKLWNEISKRAIDPSANGNRPIVWASYKGYVQSVIYLLADHRVDPVACNNAAIRLASSNGHKSVVSVLLSDPRVNPSALNNYALRKAAGNGHVEIVELLLKHVQPTPLEIDKAIKAARRKKKYTVTTMLLQDQAVCDMLINQFPYLEPATVLMIYNGFHFFEQSAINV